MQEYEYQLIRNNVNNSKIIQIGLTLSDEHGRVPQGVCTWQFNFQFQMGYKHRHVGLTLSTGTPRNC